MGIKFLLKELWTYGPTQEFINRRYKREGVLPIAYKHIKSLTLMDGTTFPIKTKEDFSHCLCIRHDYQFDDIRKDDIVIDLGANIGGFSIPAAQKSDHVYAVEPLFYKELGENIDLNCVPHVRVMATALGKKGENQWIEYMGKKQVVPCITFPEIKEFAGGCDFLKCDCEGAEHLLTLDDLQGIRRIELELHGNPASEKRFLDMLSQEFDYVYDCVYSGILTGSLGIVHATRKGLK